VSTRRSPTGRASARSSPRTCTSRELRAERAGPAGTPRRAGHAALSS
jgi:hypothetical protein